MMPGTCGDMVYWACWHTETIDGRIHSISYPCDLEAGHEMPHSHTLEPGQAGSVNRYSIGVLAAVTITWAP